jgi:hypothetical protein
MGKPKGRTTKAAKRPSIQETAEALERAHLRRARDHQRRLTMLARSLQRATETADIWRLKAARQLVERTDFVVIAVDAVESLERRLDAADKLATSLRGRLEMAERPREFAEG